MPGDSDPLDFSHRSVFITGGTKGVGRGIAERFLAAGADVVVTARSEPERPVAVGDRRARFVAADVRDPDQVAAAVAEAVDATGRLDVAVNNAGGAPPADAATASPRFSESVLRLNLLAALHVSQAANAVMQAQDEGGSIVNIGSVSGVRPSPGSSVYGAAKAGLVGLTQSLAVEWAPKVRLNVISAGLIRTEAAHEHFGDDEAIARIAATVPLGRLATPDDIAGIVLFLASPLAAYVTGANLVAHGGGEWPAFLGAAQG